MNSSRTLWLRACLFVALAGTALSSCSVSTDGPAMSGASHGSLKLASQNMCDYYYRKAAGWTYTFQNVEHIYNSDGSVATTNTGAADYVYTMGFDGFAPTGDSLFRYQVTYRVLSSYAGRGFMDVYYVPSTTDDDTHGAFIAAGTDPNTVTGSTPMLKRPRPVSTDTILAGVAGFVRTTDDDFTNAGTYSWQVDTLWTTSHLDSVFIWERFSPGAPLQKERCLFVRNFQQNDSWIYDLTNPSNSTTYSIVADPVTSIAVPNGTYSKAAEMRIYTNEVDDHDFNREYKWYAAGTGLVYQRDWWYVTTDGASFVKHDFQRSLYSLTN